MSFNAKRGRGVEARRAAVVLGAVVVLLPAAARGANRYYIGPDGGNWSTAANWSTVEGGGGSSGSPAHSDHVFIRGPLTQTVHFDTGYSPASRIGTLHVDSSAAAVSTVSQTLTTTQMRATHEHIGVSSGGRGAYLYTGGNHELTGSIYLGHGEGSHGQYTIGGTANLLVGGYTYIGYSGSGTFAQTGGTHTISQALRLGEWGGSSGMYQLSGGRLISQSATIASAGNATFEQTGGTFTVNSTFIIGSGMGQTSRYDLSAGQLSVGGPHNYIGGYGSATFNQTGGTHTMGGNLYLGEAPGGSATYILGEGARFSVIGQERLGYGGNGTFLQTGGTHSVSHGTVGSSAGSHGFYQLSAGLRIVQGPQTIGAAGHGTFVQSGGTHIVESELFMGASTGSSGRYELSGDGLLEVRFARTESIGQNGPATFAQSGGTHVATGIVYVGAGATGRYALSAGTLAPHRLWIKPQGTLAMGGGTIDIGDGGIDIDGVADFSGAPSVINATSRGILDFGHATSFTNTAGLTINGSPQTLAIFPAGFDPATQLAGYHNAPGVTGFAGSTVVIPAGKSIIGDAELQDHVHVEGSLAKSRWLVLDGGLTLDGSGVATVDELTTDGRTSAIADSASLTVTNFAAVGDKASGSFVQSGGTHTITTLSVGRQNVPWLGVRGQGSYTLSAGTLTAGNETIGSSGDGTFVQTGGTHTVTGTLGIAQNSTATGTFTLAGGTLHVGTLVNRGTFIHQGGTLSVNNLQLANGTLTLAPGNAEALKLTSLSAGAGTLDVQDNALIVTAGDIGSAAGGTYGGITGMIQSARNDGAWDGAGLTSSMAASTDGLTSLGIATAGQTGYAGGTFGGVSVGAGDVLVMYTYAGDANLDGFISGDDYSAIDFASGTPGASGWVNGDFNYDGIISGDDYSTIDFNLVAQGEAFAAGGSLRGVAAVPEPGFGGTVFATALALLRRRRRSRDLV